MTGTQCSAFAMRMSLVPGRLSASYFNIVWRNMSCSTRNIASSARTVGSNDKEVAKSTQGGPGTKATEEQLVQVKNRMTESLPKFFINTHNFEDYHPNLLFEDNIRNVRCSGIFNYYLQVTQTRWFCLCRYTTSSVKVLKATHDTQDSKVCIRWTFQGRFLMKYFKEMIYARFKSENVPPCRTIDGFSIMYVGGDGRVWKHVIEKMIPDTDSVFRTDAADPLISPKIGGASLAVDPKP